LGETRTAATNAQQTADDVAKVQSAYPAVNAQGPRHNFSMMGDARFNLAKPPDSTAPLSWPISRPFSLFRASDDVLFEAGFDAMLNNNTDPVGNRLGPGSSTSFSLSFAQLDYLWNDYVTVVAGDMLLPLGTYSERSARLAQQVAPMTRWSGTFCPAAAWARNCAGPSRPGRPGRQSTIRFMRSTDRLPARPTPSPTPRALDLGGNVGDTPNWHSTPSAGGRIGWFYPWKPHHDLELGISGQTGEWAIRGTGCGRLRWGCGPAPGENFEVKGEYINTWVETDDLGKKSGPLAGGFRRVTNWRA